MGYYTSSRVIELTKCRVSPARNIANAEKAFIIESPEKSFIVWAKSTEERDNWLKDITASMDSLKSIRDAEAGDIAPIWTPDGDCLQCEQCSTQFTMLLRRHHCRNCGAIVCDACSKKRFLVLHIHQTKEQRVCDLCFEDLSNPDAVNSSTDAPTGDGDVVVPKSNLPKRGRQSVILRGLDVEKVNAAIGNDPTSTTSPASNSVSSDNNTSAVVHDTSKSGTTDSPQINASVGDSSSAPTGSANVFQRMFASKPKHQEPIMTVTPAAESVSPVAPPPENTLARVKSLLPKKAPKPTLAWPVAKDIPVTESNGCVGVENPMKVLMTAKAAQSQQQGTCAIPMVFVCAILCNVVCNTVDLPSPPLPTSIPPPLPTSLPPSTLPPKPAVPGNPDRISLAL